MNICICMGKIISNINFQFIYEGNNISIVTFNIKLSNNSIIEARAYDENADYIYSKLKKEDNIIIVGILRQNYLLINEIYQ